MREGLPDTVGRETGRIGGIDIIFHIVRMNCHWERALLRRSSIENAGDDFCNLASK